MPKPKPVTFTVTAADDAAEIYLIDGRFRLIKKGIGHETFSVPPGLYKIKNRTGKTVTERIVVVRDGMPPIKLDPVEIDSAMPLSNSARTHEFHMDTASKAGASFNVTVGSGSAIVIVARQWTAKAPGETPQDIRNPARGLSLRDIAGTIIVDVAAQTSVSSTFDPCVSLAVEVNPGAYRLSLAYEDGRRVEQTLIASAGWQTHAYLLVDASAGMDRARVDLINAAISMRKPSEPFDPQDVRLRNEEIVRGALQESHQILSDEIRSLICAADATPMLALFGAHLLIREANDKEASASVDSDANAALVKRRDALRTIVKNLRQMIGSNSDVEAIAIAADDPDEKFVFDVPPMFRASWPLLLQASVSRPDSIPATSFNAHVAERIWGEGVWLLWLEATATPTIDRATLWQSKAEEILGSISAKRLTADHAQLPQPATPRNAIWGGLTAAADVTAAVVPKVKSFFTRRTRTPFPASLSSAPDEPVANVDLHGIGATLSADQRQQLVEQVGVPMSSINTWLDQI